jgi:hypothetical protein
MGPQVCQLLATLCVILFLALFAWGNSDSTSGFCLRQSWDLFWIRLLYPMM